MLTSAVNLGSGEIRETQPQPARCFYNLAGQMDGDKLAGSTAQCVRAQAFQYRPKGAYCLPPPLPSCITSVKLLNRRTSVSSRVGRLTD